MNILKKNLWGKPLEVTKMEGSALASANILCPIFRLAFDQTDQRSFGALFIS